MRLAALAFLGLTACAQTIAAANELGGTISNHGWSHAKTLELAQAHCQKYGRNARITATSTLDATATFECVS